MKKKEVKKKITLKPCPFCGATAKYRVLEKSDTVNLCDIQCTSCYCNVNPRIVGWYERSEIADYWNLRY